MDKKIKTLCALDTFEFIYCLKFECPILNLERSNVNHIYGLVFYSWNMKYILKYGKIDTVGLKIQLLTSLIQRFFQY